MNSINAIFNPSLHLQQSIVLHSDIFAFLAPSCIPDPPPRPSGSFKVQVNFMLAGHCRQGLNDMLTPQLNLSGPWVQNQDVEKRIANKA